MTRVLMFFKKNCRLILIALFFFIIVFFVNPLNVTMGDGMWNYGFAYSISKGLIPYTEINMITTPLYAFLGAFFLKIFGEGYHVFLIYHTLLIVLLFYFLFKMFDKKIWILFFIIMFFYYIMVHSTYNFLLVLWFVIIIYLEKENKSDYLLGLIIGLSILTKQSVGIFFFLPSLIYLKKDFKKVAKRVVGILIPCCIFLIYLLVQGNFYDFLNLCFFGMFDFAAKNGKLGLFVIISLILLIIIGYRIWKNPKDIYNYYILACFSFVIPLFDYHHFSYFIFCFLVCILDKIKYNEELVNKVICIFVGTLTIYLFIDYSGGFNIKRFKKYDQFKYYIVTDKEYKIRENILKEYNKYDNVIMLNKDSSSVFYNIITRGEAGKYSVFLHGNFGYGSYDKMCKEFDKMHKQVFFIYNVDKMCRYDQYYFELSEFVKSKSEKIGSVEDLDIYYKE